MQLPGKRYQTLAARPCIVMHCWGHKIDRILHNNGTVFQADQQLCYVQASENAKQRDGFGATWAQDYYLPAKADG